MFEKVNPAHPDKIADRIAGAIVDLAYSLVDNPRIAVEVLIGHGKCHIITETSVILDANKIKRIVKRIAGNVEVDYVEVPQDRLLSDNQEGKITRGVIVGQGIKGVGSAIAGMTGIHGDSGNTGTCTKIILLVGRIGTFALIVASIGTLTEGISAIIHIQINLIGHTHEEDLGRGEAGSGMFGGREINRQRG